MFRSCKEIEKDEYCIGLFTADDEHPDLSTIELTKKRISEVNLFKADDSIILNTSDDYSCRYQLFSKSNRISKQGDTLNCAVAYVKEADLKLKDSVNLGFFLKAI